MGSPVTGFLHIARIGGGCRSCQRRVPHRLRAIGRLASRPPGQVRGARLAHGLSAAGRCPDFGDRTDVAGSREAAGALHPADRADARPARGARAVAPPGDATGDEAMGVYSDLRGFALAHRSLASCAATRIRSRRQAIGSGSSAPAARASSGGSPRTMRRRICCARRCWRSRIDQRKAVSPDSAYTSLRSTEVRRRRS